MSWQTSARSAAVRVEAGALRAMRAGTDESGRHAPSVALVRDWLTVQAGADRVMDAVLELYPDAPVHALVYRRERFEGTRLAGHPVHTSFIQRLPFGARKHHAYLPLMPFAIEQFDLSAHDLVISLSHAVAKGVLTRPDQLHISYVFTPMRYAWDLYFDYLRDAGLDRGGRGWIVRALLHYVRLWDQTSAARPDIIVAASRYVARRIRKLYRRDAPVIYPPVDVERFTPQLERDDCYVTVSRLVPYKRIDIIIEAFNRLGRPLIVIGDGPERRRLARLAGPSVQLLGERPDAEVTARLERCRAFVFAAEEDFGIAPVEAQAAGAPVIAFGRGGVTESVVPGETGLLFERQTPDSLMDAVRRFENSGIRFHPALLHCAAERFSRCRFQREFDALVTREWSRFREQEYVGQPAGRGVGAVS